MKPPNPLGRSLKTSSGAVVKAIAKLLSITSGTLILYVAYLHVSALMTMSAELDVDVIDNFSSVERTGRLFTHSRSGPCHATHESGFLKVRGSTGNDVDGLCRLHWGGDPLRLRDMIIRMKFRARDTAPYDLLVGVETSEKKSRYARFGVVNSKDEAHYALKGHEGVDGEVKVPDPDIHAFDQTLSFQQRDLWHVAELRISPDAYSFFVSIDGLPVGSAASRWFQGTPVRLTLDVIGRAPGQAIELDIDEVAIGPASIETDPVDFIDTFRGKLVDPRQWRYVPMPLRDTESGVSTGPSGLRMHGRMLRKTTGSVVSNVFIGPTRELRSFRLRLHYTIAKLHRAGFFVGVSNIRYATPLWRAFDTGIQDKGKTWKSFIGGHWQRIGQFRKEHSDVPVAKTGSLEIEFDMATKIAVVRLDELEIGRKVADLNPLEPVYVHFGANMSDGESEFDVTIERIDFTRRDS